MHIEPGVVDGAKLLLGYTTALGAVGLAGKLLLKGLYQDGGIAALASRSVLTTAMVLGFFEVLPNFPIGVSEVHFILGSSLFLLFGAGAASIGLAMGLLLQGLLLSPADLPQYGMNITTLLVPLWVLSVLAKKIIAPNTAYVDLRYRQVLALSTAYQGGIVAWVAFWAFYGQGFGAENLAAVGAFSAAYTMVIILEPLADLAILFGAKSIRRLSFGGLLTKRLYNPAL